MRFTAATFSGLLVCALCECSSTPADNTACIEGRALEGEFEISDDADLEELKGYVEIDGDVTLRGKVTSLDSLVCLERVSGSLRIGSKQAHVWSTEYDSGVNFTCNGTLELENLRGLENLRSVGHLSIQCNESLADIDALDNLKTVDGNLTITDNVALQDINGLIGIEIVGQEVVIDDNPALLDLDGLANLVEVIDDLKIGVLNPESEDTSGNESLASIEGLSNLVYARSLTVAGNAVLTDLAGLDNLVSVYSDIWIEGNGSLTSLEALGNLSSAWCVAIVDNPALESLAGLNGIEWLDYLLINGNQSLNDLGALTGLHEIQWGLVVRDCPALASLDGIGISSGLQVGAGLQLVNNEALVDIGALSMLDGVLGQLIVDDNDSLVDISPLSGIVHIGSEDIFTWEGLALGVRGNDSLTDLHGLHNVTGISNGDVRIEENPQLESLQALLGVTAFDSDLHVTGNSSLPTCEATGFRNQLTSEGWSGGACITENEADTCEDDLSGCEDL